METIRTYLENLFAGLPEDERLVRAKEELLSTMEDKYNSLKEEGKSENEAVGAVIRDFGNIDELLEELEISRDSAVPDEIGKSGAAVCPGEKETREYLRSTHVVGWLVGIGVLLVMMGVASLFAINGWVGDCLGKYNIAGTLSVVVMLMFIAVGVILFVTAGVKSNNDKQYVTQIVEMPDHLREKLTGEHKKNRVGLGISIGAGVACIIAGVCALIVIASFPPYNVTGTFGAAVMMVMIGVGVMLMCAADGKEDGYKHLLNIDKMVTVDAEGNKVVNKKTRAVAIFEAILWPVTVITFFVWGFVFDGWAISWIVYPIAGILNSCVSSIVAASE